MRGQIDITQEMIIDNFAGGGGASTGIELATGHPVDVAINHDPASIQMHKKNHPYTHHYCEDVWEIDPRKVARGRKVALCWFSPDCKHFSKAKGGKPREKKIRGLAWVAVRWAATVKPRVIILENVEEFKTWGPLTADGQPDIDQKGRTFNCFINALKAQGYEVDWRELKACDYGAPTIRKRFFLIARCDGKPITWPEPTHGEGRLPYRTAAEIIDWSLPCPSIFDTTEEIKEKYGVRAVRPLAEKTLKRIARGIQKFVIDNPNPFIVTNTTGHNASGIDKPIPTLTTGNQQIIVTPNIVQVNHGGDTFRGQDMESPMSTITAKCGYGVVSPVMTAIGQTGFSEDRSYGMDEPVKTIVSKAEQCVVAPSLIQYHSEQSEREIRGQSISEPILTVDAAPRYALVSAFVHKYFDGGYAGCGSEAKEPIGTVTSVDHNAVVTSNLCVLRNNQDGKDWREPMPTITTSPGHFAEVRAFLLKYYGEGVGQSVNDPCGTTTTKDRFGIITVKGTKYMIADIGLRMLTPRELYNAQGFPPDYIIDFDVDGKRYSKKEQVARCGNSVPPPFAEALVRANLQEMCGNRYTTMADLERGMVAI